MLGSHWLIDRLIIGLFLLPFAVGNQQGWEHLGLTEESGGQVPSQVGRTFSTDGCFSLPPSLIARVIWYWNAFFSVGSVFRVCQFYSIET